MTFSEQEAREERVRAFLAAVRQELGGIEDATLSGEYTAACNRFDDLRRATSDLWNEVWQLRSAKMNGNERRRDAFAKDADVAWRTLGIDRANLTRGDEGGWRKEDGE